MADRMACEIWIGGKFPMVCWTSSPFPICGWISMPLRLTPRQRKAFDARDENGLLHFADCEAAWGEFAVLEDWLREHNMPFRRHSSGKYRLSAGTCGVSAGPRQGNPNHRHRQR